MAKNRVLKSFATDTTWTVPGGVTKVKVRAVRRVQALGASRRSSLAITEAGQAYMWGTIAAASSPTIVPGTSDFNKGAQQVSGQGWAANMYSAGLLDEFGNIMTWGLGFGGALGNNSTANQTSPVMISGARRFKQIAHGGSHCMGLLVDGSAVGWGTNTSGQIGDNTLTTKSSPAVVAGTQKWLKLAAGNGFTAGINLNGQLYTWGANNSGQLGHNDSTDRSSPVLVSAVSGRKFIDVSCGGGFTLALEEDGTIWGMGFNNSRQLGLGTTSTAMLVPTQVVTNLKFAKIFAGGASSFAITKDADGYSWGGNSGGTLGHNELYPLQEPADTWGSPKLIAGSKKWVTFGPCTETCIGLTTDGEVFGWGDNTYGSVGDGTLTNRSSPVLVNANLTWKCDTLEDNAVEVTVVPGQSYDIKILAKTMAFGPTSVAKGTGMTRLELEYYT